MNPDVYGHQRPSVKLQNQFDLLLINNFSFFSFLLSFTRGFSQPSPQHSTPLPPAISSNIITNRWVSRMTGLISAPTMNGAEQRAGHSPPSRWMMKWSRAASARSSGRSRRQWGLNVIRIKTKLIGISLYKSLDSVSWQQFSFSTSFLE